MTNQINTRELVLDILLAVTKDGEYSHIVLKNVLDKYDYLDKRDRSFISRVSHGTLERMLELDGILNQFSNTKVNKMKPVIRNILRSGLYQLLYMDSVPASAACNEAVKLAEKKGFHNLKGFVNGVLRNISRNINEIKYPSESDFVNYMQYVYSIPEWITRLWQQSLTKEQILMMGDAFLSERPTSVRVHTGKIAVDELQKRLLSYGIEVRQHPDYEEVLYISHYDSLGRIPEFVEGMFYVQDISSMEVGRALQLKEGEFGIDVCAAPGGKSIHAAELMDGTGKIIARDVSYEKVALIEENCKRVGAGNVVAQCHDALVLDKQYVGEADFVIADLPCSGLGVLGKKPDIKYHITEDKIQELAELQRNILNVVCQYVKPDGRMIYSTCTINHIENEDNVKAFLKEHREYSLEQERQLFPQGGMQDGFYYACLRREKK